MGTEAGHAGPAASDTVVASVGDVVVDFAAVFDTLLDPAILLEAVRDESGRIADFDHVYANQAALDFSGLKRDELVRHRLRGVFPDQVELGLLAKYAAVVDGGEPLAVDDLCYSPGAHGGGEHWFDLRAVRVGWTDVLSCTWRDVSQRHAASSALAASRDRYRWVAENAMDLIYVARLDRIVEWVSPTVTRTLGWSPQELVGTVMAELVHPEDRAATETAREQAYATGSFPSEMSGQLVVRMRTKAGDYRWMAARVSPITDAAGDPASIVVGMRDVDDLIAARERAEAASQAANLTRMTIESAAVGMSITAPDGHFVRVNESLCRMLKYERAQLEGMAFADVTHPDDAAAGIQAARDLALGRGDSFTQRKRYIASTGDIVWIDLFVAPVRDESGALLHFIAQMVDVTAEVLAFESLERSMQRFRLLAENASDVVYQTDRTGVIQWISPSVRGRLGWEPEFLVGTRAESLVEPGDLVHAQVERAQAYAGLDVSGVILRFRATDGTYRHMSLASHPLLETDGHIYGAVVGLRDVTDEHKVRVRLERSERQFRLAMLRAPQGMALAGPDGRFTDVNPALERLLGVPEDGLLGRRLEDLLAAEDLDEARRIHEVVVHADVDVDEIVDHEHRIISSQGEMWFGHSVGLLRGESGEPLFSVHQFSDQTAARQQRAALEHKASHDPLTGLANRTDLMHRLGERLALTEDRRSGSGSRIGVLFCDLDNLKTINDNLSHQTGDIVLVAVAEQIQRSVRAGDIVARVGGDEFVVVLDPAVDIDAVRGVAEKIQRAASKPIDIAGTNVPVSISIGATLADPDEDPDAVLNRADKALQQAKRSGRNRVMVYEVPDDAASHNIT